MTALQETKSRGAGRRWPLWVLAAVVLVALALLVEAFLRAEEFSPGEKILSPSIRDVTVSDEDALYPPANVGRFESPPETVFVYLNVEGAPGEEDMEVRVERSENAPAFALLFGREPEVVAVDEQEDQLSSDESGASGIVKFALESRSGGPVPPGNYTLEVYGPPVEDPGGSPGERAAVRKFFIVEG